MPSVDLLRKTKQKNGKSLGQNPLHNSRPTPCRLKDPKMERINLAHIHQARVHAFLFAFFFGYTPFGAEPNVLKYCITYLTDPISVGQTPNLVCPLTVSVPRSGSAGYITRWTEGGFCRRPFFVRRAFYSQHMFAFASPSWLRELHFVSASQKCVYIIHSRTLSIYVPQISHIRVVCKGQTNREL